MARLIRGEHVDEPADGDRVHGVVVRPEILVREDDYALVSSVLVTDRQRFGTWLERMLLPLA